MNKCIGCGAVLQSVTREQEGYVLEKNKDKNMCERCFRIQNYNDYQVVLKDNHDFFPILEAIPKKALVLLVIDPFFLQEDLSMIKDYVKNPILLVLTKRDLFPKDLYEEKILNYMNTYHIPFVDSIFVSSKNNYNFDLLFRKIKQYQTLKEVYVIGFTNAGKSTLINRLMFHYSSNSSKITTSILPSTTLNTITIPLDDTLTLIDTPGLLEEGSLLNYVDGKTLKKIIPRGEIHPKIYQVHTKQFFEIEDFAIITVTEGNFVFYLSNALSIKRFYKKREDLKERQEFLIDRKCDIVLTGLGFIKVTTPCKICISTNQSIKIYKRDSIF